MQALCQYKNSESKHYRMLVIFPIIHIFLFLARNLKTAVAAVDLSVLGINAAESGSLAVGKLVHGSLGNVEASAGVVHGKDVDAVAVVGEAEALTALSYC